jgi:calcineurin-like phosphoesterase family protein
MKTFVTSNLQLGRPSAIKKYNRSYDDVDEMTEDLILKWNSVVNKEDTVYHLGNFAHDPKTAQDSIVKLNGTIKFIEGDFDTAIILLNEKGMLDPKCSIINCVNFINDFNCAFSYWPMSAWPKKTTKSWSIIGYPDKKHKSNPKVRIINVSTDLWQNTPQELEKLIGIFSDF